MKISLIGCGAMGTLIRSLADSKGHKVGAMIGGADAESSPEELASELAGSDAVIDFSTAEAVGRNVRACMLAGVPLVEGTTGWDAERGEIERSVTGAGGTMVFGANFSIGVNLFYQIADFAAELFSRFPDYELFIEEQHHSRKKDAPSGTALKLKQIVSGHIDREISVCSTRAGNIPGTHRIGIDGPADQILMEHSARSREGFAQGAIVAAEWVVGKKGFFEFTDVLGDTSRNRLR